MTTLLNTLICEKGELFTIGRGRRILFAHCKPKINIYEKSIQISVLGKTGFKKKSIRFTVALCGDIEFCRDVNEETLQKTERYELTADLLRNDGVVERFYFHNIRLLEINQNDEWEFELDVTDEQQRAISTMAGIQ